MSTTHVSQVVYDAIVAASKLDDALFAMIGAEKPGVTYPLAVKDLHFELRDALKRVPPTLGVVDAR